MPSRSRLLVPRYLAIAAALLLWGAAGAKLDDVALAHVVVSDLTPWLALFLISALVGWPRPGWVFVSTAVGSVGGVLAYYAWKELGGQGLWVPGLMLWTTVAVTASAMAASLTASVRRSPSCAAAFLMAGGGFALGETAWTIATSQINAPNLLSAGVDVALALLLLSLAERSRAGQAARSPSTAGNLQRLGWLGSGAAFFWIVLLSIRTVVA
jgi:hypothetical protein